MFVLVAVFGGQQTERGAFGLQRVQNRENTVEYGDQVPVVGKIVVPELVPALHIRDAEPAHSVIRAHTEGLIEMLRRQILAQQVHRHLVQGRNCGGLTVDQRAVNVKYIMPIHLTPAQYPSGNASVRR